MSSHACDGFGTLNVWVSKLGNPCATSDRDWFVTIWRCDGDVLEWCGKKYVVMTAKCGRLSVKLPPGRYVVSAVWSFTQLPEGGYRANHFTNRTIVTMGCGDSKCVELYNPKVHTCGTILLKAAQDLVGQPEVAGWGEVEQQALDAAVQPLLAAVPNDGTDGLREPMFDIDPEFDEAAMELFGRIALPPPEPGDSHEMLDGRIEPEDVAEELAKT